MSAITTLPTSAPEAAPRPVKPSPGNRLGFRFWNYLKAAFGLPWQRRFARAALKVAHIRYWEKKYDKLDDAGLKTTGLLLRGRARGGESLDKLLPEAYGLVCIAAKRRVGMRPFDVQLAGGVILHEGGLAELATGEGKTLTASLPVFLNALEGKGVHVATVNDYLARRDCELMIPIYEALGLTAGAIQMQMPDAERVAAYRCDLTYGTASEFGFDFLRDRLKVAGARGQESPFWAPWMPGGAKAPMDTATQRPHHFALVDEADSIFVDEARTPLIISKPTRPATPAECVVYTWANDLAKQMLLGQDFTYDQKKQKLELTDIGKERVRYSNPPSGEFSHAMDKLHDHVEQALQAHYRFRRDQHYMVLKEKVVIVDEFTGRPMPDRHWREGLHQAVEAKERVTINQAVDHAAQITFQSYFRLYTKLCGMTGTAAQNRLEVRRVYKLWVVCVPTNRPCIRKTWPDRVFPTQEAKFEAIVREVLRLRDQGRAVLIGTRSVSMSEELAKRLEAAGLKEGEGEGEYKVLNARQNEQEAQIVSMAGLKGRVTIATNMAGRGTDIKPTEEVVAAGGLHVLGTERHEALRIDRQLAGRAGRQGDLGSSQFFLSLEDELLEGLGAGAKLSWEAFGQRGGARDWDRYRYLFENAQRRMEKRHYTSRVDLMVHEKHRQEILKDLGADPYVD